MEGDSPAPAQHLQLPPKSKPSRKRKRSSPAWEHFVDVEPNDPEYPKAECIYCSEIVPYHRVKYETSLMLSHTRTCNGRRNAEGKDDPYQQLLSYDSKLRAWDPSAVGDLRIDRYDERKLRRSVAACLILDELPLSQVEKEGFSRMLHAFDPRWTGVSRRTVTRDCMALYLEEKENLRVKLLELRPRTCFTTDTWTCTHQTTTYMCLTSHFIDRSWVLHKRIIGFQKLDDHAGIGISQQLTHFMDLWGLEKVLTITVDNATPNDKALSDFKKKQVEKFGSIAGHIIQNHDHLQVRSSSHILNLIVKEGLDELGTTVEKMRALVRYVRSSPKRLSDFKKKQVEKFGSIAGHIIQNHDHLQVRSSSHILNLIVKEGLDELGTTVEKMRALVRYVRSSPKRLDSFNMYVSIHTSIENHTTLKDDIPTRWNSTYTMFELVLHYEDVFVRMIDADKQLDHYLSFDSKGRKRDVDLIPTPGDWSQVKSFTKFLKIFYDVTLKFSASKSVTTNIFFQEVAKIDKQLQLYSVDEDECLRNMDTRMQMKFDKYWGEFTRVDLELPERKRQDPNKSPLNHLLMFATVLDPRAKLKWFNWWFSVKMSKERRIDAYNKVKRAVRIIFEEYDELYGKSSNPDGVGTSQPAISQDDYGFGSFTNDMSSVETKSELELYLDVVCVPLSGPFDILEWWKANESTYPVLSHMARDVLAIPISTVPSEATFSIGGRVLDSTRSSLTPTIAEALILTQNWISKISKDIESADCEDMAEVEKELLQTPQNFKL